MSDSISRTAARHRSGFYCPRCGLYGVQRWDALGFNQIDESGEWFEALDAEGAGEKIQNVFDAPPVDPWNTPVVWVTSEPWARSLCTGCAQSTVWYNERIVYPGGRFAPPAHPDMPPTPRELYEEAALVIGVSRRAGAAMARATLERLLIEVDTKCPPKSNLDDRIVHVIPQVPSSLGDVLTVIRHVGNKALHVADAPDDALVLVLNQDDAAIVDVNRPGFHAAFVLAASPVDVPWF